jgi:hypothetical protein
MQCRQGENGEFQRFNTLISSSIRYHRAAIFESEFNHGVLSAGNSATSR